MAYVIPPRSFEFSTFLSNPEGFAVYRALYKWQLSPIGNKAVETLFREACSICTLPEMSISHLLEAIDTYYSLWINQPAKVRGNPVGKGRIARSNKVIFKKIYKDLGLPVPQIYLQKSSR